MKISKILQKIIFLINIQGMNFTMHAPVIKLNELIEINIRN